MLEPAANHAQIRSLGMPDGDDEVLTCEDMQFPELHFLGIIEIPGGPQDGKQRAPVAFEFWSLMCRDRILDGKFMQSELPSYGTNFVSIRPVETNPCHTMTLAKDRIRLFKGLRISTPLAVHIHHIVH